MSKRPNLKSLQPLFDKGKDFSLTDAQYEKKTGAPLPKDKYYIIAGSAAAKAAAKNGYKLEVIEKRIKFKKIEGEAK